tara:strand:- start:910 stop:2091 length:1182 start_codon:yes stop_codon:yes gene_type:complete
VLPSGTKTWRQKYSFGGKEKQLTHGRYPELSLKEARVLRDKAKALLRASVDPGAKAKEKRDIRQGRATQGETFRTAARRWHTLQSHGWKERHADHVWAALEADVLPELGERAISDLKAADIREVIEAIQDRGAIDQAHRSLMRISRIFQLAIVDGTVEANPAAALGAILKPVPKRKYPAILQLDVARSALKAFEEERHFPAVKLASRFLALTAARPGPLRYALPAEFEDLDGDEPRWVIPAAKMKLERAESEQESFAFTIPLSRQAVEVVKSAIAEANGRTYLFPSAQHGLRPISENALNVAYRRSAQFAGRHVPHGWRSTFSTIMNERAADLDRPGDRAVLDLMLGHKPAGVEAHYNRAAYMPRRRLLAQEWADLISKGLVPPDRLREGPRH